MSSIKHAARILLLATLGVAAGAQAQAVLSGAAELAAGYAHTCAVLDDGNVSCWGSNLYGQLGDGTGVGNPLPETIDVGGVATRITAGIYHTCAIVDGGLKCWGANFQGQIGDGTDDNVRDAPVPVSGLDHGVEAVSGGSNHTCAIVDGGAMCWGINTDGEIGTGTTSHSIDVPTAVSGLSSGVTDIAAGGLFTCAVVDGGAMCWGDNQIGELGNGSNEDSSVPTPVVGLDSGVTRVVANVLMACAIVDGGVKCWGGWMLGDGTYADSNVPVDVTGLGADVIDLAMGNGGFVCATTSDRVAHCWGYDGFGQFGDDSYVDLFSPVDVHWTQFDPMSWSAGGGHTCALDDGDVYCWGSNVSGQLGIGSSLFTPSTPTPVVDLDTPATKIRIGIEAACAIASSGSLECWGANNHGELGDGTHLPRGTAVPVLGLGAGVSDVAVYNDHTCAIVDGGAFCWGNNVTGELGDGTNTTRWTATAVAGLDHDVEAITVGFDHSCAIFAGVAKCWGLGAMLGNGGTDSENAPVDAVGLSGVTAIAAGDNHTCAVIGGAAKCWGVNYNGQLGDGGDAAETALEPVQVAGLTSGVTAIAAAGATTCAIVDGGAQCWGSNLFGNLGNGTYVDSNVPVHVTSLDSGVLDIEVGTYHTCANTTSGAKCWGDNGALELGTLLVNGSSTIPVDVTMLSPEAGASIATGSLATCAIESGSGVCWGYNTGGQIGDGGVPWLPAPRLSMVDAIFADGFDG